MVLKIFNSVIYILLIVLLPIVVNSTPINNVEENDSTQTTTSTTTTANRQSTKYEIEEIPDEEGLDNRTIVVIIMVSVAFAFVLLGVFMVIRSSMKKNAQRRNDAVADKEAPQPRRQSFDSINKEPDGKYINMNENGHVNDDVSKAPAPRMFAKNPQRNFSLTNAAAAAANAEANTASQPRVFGQDMRNFSLTATKNNGSAQQQQENNRKVSPNERFHYDRSIEEEDEEEYDDEEDENKFYLDDQDDDQDGNRNNNGHYEQPNIIPPQKDDVEMTQF